MKTFILLSKNRSRYFEIYVGNARYAQFSFISLDVVVSRVRLVNVVGFCPKSHPLLLFLSY